MENFTDDVGVVVIGRNEGERLRQCIQSVINQVDKIVYVDSGSLDGSVEYVESIGVDGLRLDMKVPFSAARARNIGFEFLYKKHNRLKYIQFIDGDCQCCEGWLSSAYSYLQNNEHIAIVAGRRKERFPHKSIYNTLCDIEWDTPVGEASACGGDFMIRKTALKQVDGFNPVVVAGEEPELCYRLRKMNWSIFRLDHPMTLHDAAITKFPQWWKRCIRAGHAYAQGFLLHLRDGKGYCFKESLRIWLWAFVFPVCVLILAVSINISFLLLITAYLVQFARIAFRTYKRYRKVKISIAYSFFIIIGKWPELIGQVLFLKRKLSRQGCAIIEYR